MMLYYFVGEGWVGANRTFFETLHYDDIAAFNSKNESIRDVFLSESEEIFTESDKSWLDYIRKYKRKGYRLSIAKDRHEVMSIDAKCHTFSKNQDFYVLELADVTELDNAQKETNEVERLKTMFLSNIGHEFRTPMNGILGFIELLQNTQLDNSQSEYIKMIGNSSKSLMTNIETLLDLSQYQSNRLEVESNRFNMLPKIEKLSYDFHFKGKEKGIKVLTFIYPKIPQEIMSDASRISQVMHSLMQNAMDFTPRGGKIIIESKLLQRQQNGDCSIGFGVRDNGTIIPKEQIKNIEKPFSLDNRADNRLGVELSLAYGIVNLLGSELKIHSKEEEGTYINFVLDIKGTRGQNYKMMPKRKVKVLLLDQKRVEEANFLTIYLRAFAIDVIKSNQLDENVYDGVEALYIVANQDDSSWMLELGTYSKKAPIILLIDEKEKLQTKLMHIIDDTVTTPLLPSSIAKHLKAVSSIAKTALKDKLELPTQLEALIVEDNLINQRLIQILLQGYNISVSTASNGGEALSACALNKYDIIFMDIDMPGKNGIVTTKEIKEGSSVNKKTPIVALTALAMDGDREMLLAKGLDNYLAKPLNREKLEHVLSIYLKVTASTAV